jgi:hypothetical protein
MKFISSLTISFLLFAFITNLPQAFSYDDGKYIMDSNMWPLHQDGRYAMIPSFMGLAFGRVYLGKTGDSTCPVTVLDQDITSERGIPVKISVPGDPYYGDILTGEPVDIEFVRKPDCVKSSKWLIFVDNVIQKSCVGIGGPENYPGKQILNGTFLIRRSGGGFQYIYKFVFCVNGSTTNCSDLGYYNIGAMGGRLILNAQQVSSFLFVEDYSYKSIG